MRKLVPLKPRKTKRGAKVEAEPELPQEPKSENMNWYILKVQSNREDSIREGLLAPRGGGRPGTIFRRHHRADGNGLRIQGRQEAGGQAKAVSRLSGRPHGDQRRDVVPGARDARDRRFYRFGRQAEPDVAAGSRPDHRQAGREVGRAPKLKIDVKQSDRVKINEGTFENFEGEVDTIDEANGRVTVMINIFGRSTPVELEYWQIEKV